MLQFDNKPLLIRLSGTPEQQRLFLDLLPILADTEQVGTSILGKVNFENVQLIAHRSKQYGTIDILQTIKKLTDKNINVTVTALGMDTLLPNGKVNESFKIVLSVMATLAEMERTKLKERQRQGIELAKKKGKYKGRTVGATKSTDKLLSENKAVVKELKKETPLSLRKIAAIGNCSVNTVQKVKRALLEAA